MLDHDFTEKTFPPLNTCMYCGTSDELTDEHIVPYGLVGNWLILPKSSCKTCAKKTSAVELAVLRGTLDLFRNATGSPTRRPKQRSAAPRVPIGRRFGRGPIQPTHEGVRIPLEELPRVYVCLKMGLPGVLLGGAPADEYPIEIFSIHPSKTSPAFRRISQRREALRLASIHPLFYMRFLAKVAHAFAVGELGLGGFVPVLSDVILGNDDHARYWVGGTDEVPPPEDRLINFQMGTASRDGQDYILVFVRLYASLGTPQYVVVVGRPLA